MNFKLLILLALSISLICAKNHRSAAFNTFIEKHGQSLRKSNTQFQKHLVSLDQILGTSQTKPVNRFMQVHKKQVDVSKLPVTANQGVNAATPYQYSEHENPLMTSQEMSFLLHELNLMKFDGAEHLASASARYQAYASAAAAIAQTQDANELHNLLDEAIEDTNKAIKKSSVASIELLNAKSKLDLFNFMNFKFLNPNSFNDEINSFKTQWQELMDFVETRYEESVSLRKSLDQENYDLWNAKTLLFKRENPRYADQSNLFGVTKEQAVANYNQAVTEFSSHVTANVATIQGLQIPERGVYAARKKEFEQSYLKNLIESKAMKIAENLAAPQPKRQTSATYAKKR